MRILFISGWAESPRVWDRVVACLPEGWSCERIGFFDLVSPAGESGTATEVAVGFEHCLNRLGAFDVYCGWSLGGMVLLGSNAVRAPSIVVCASGRFVVEGGGSPTLVELRALRRELRRDPTRALARFLRTVHPVADESAAFQLEQSLAYCEGREAELLVGLRYLEEVDLNPMLASRSALQPLLFLHGGCDPLVSSESVVRTASRCAGAERILFSASAHAPMLTEAERFAAAAIGWVGRFVV